MWRASSSYDSDVVMTKLTGRERELWPNAAGSTGNASSPGTAESFGRSSPAISAALRSRSAQSVKPANEIPWDTVGLPEMTR